MFNLDGATVGFDRENNKAVFVDQTLLPNEYKETATDDFDEMFEAVKTLKVRGAPAIGVFAAISLAVLMNKSGNKSFASLFSELSDYAERLVGCRPTAVNLRWAAQNALLSVKSSTAESFKNDLSDFALKTIEHDISVCRKIGEYGAELLKDKSSFLTHCNAGRLAAVKYGTALAPVYVLKEQGRAVKVYSDETRPLLQGARLTAYELASAGIDVTLICDNAVSYAMKSGLVDAVLVGCDRVALNGDAANKIGTSGVAVLAKYYGIPFYVCMPFSTFDPNISDGSEIVIEQRDGDEVTAMWYKKRMAPDGVKALNPAFDVTDSSLITAFITEKGVIKPSQIKEYFNKL